MNYPTLKILAVLLPTLLIGGFEYARHEFLLNMLTMETGNLFITLLTLLMAYAFTSWMFSKIRQINDRLAEEKSMRAVFEERERLASELHDNIAQTLFFLNVKLQKGQLEEAKTAVSEINSEVRHAIFNLRAFPDEGVEFADRLKTWLSEWSHLSGVESETDIRLEPRYFSPNEEILLFGIIQEAFTNIRKHADADLSSLTLYGAREGWSLRITDNGGRRNTDVLEEGTYGLALMKKRAQILQAEFFFGKNESGQTEIRLSVDKKEDGHGALPGSNR